MLRRGVVGDFFAAREKINPLQKQQVDARSVCVCVCVWLKPSHPSPDYLRLFQAGDA